MTASPGASSCGPPAPLHSDWVWRPPLWCEPLFPPDRRVTERRTPIRQGINAFHDGIAPGIAICQSAPALPSSAQFKVLIDVAGFDGTFLSLAIDLPPSGISGLRRRHIVRADLRLDAPGCAETYARLNVLNGPNTEKLTQSLLPQGGSTAEFDLYHTGLDEARVEKAWLDLIFAHPGPGRILLGDLVLSRRPRAEV